MAKKKAPQRRRTTSRRKATGVRKKQTARGTRGLSSATLAQLHREIERRVKKLEERRDALLAELDEVEQEITAMGGNTARVSRSRTATGGRGRGGGRGKNAMNLVDSLQKLLKNQTMSVTEMSDAVQKAGYKTSSPNFRTIVNQTLIKNPKVFKRVGRGQYTAK